MCWSHFHIFLIHFAFYCFFSLYVLIPLCKQLGISVVKLAPPSIQVVQQSSLDLAKDVLVKTRKIGCTEKEGREKEFVSLDENDRCQKLENRQKDHTAEDGCDKKREVAEEKHSAEVQTRERGREGSGLESSLKEVVRFSYPSETLEELVRCPTPNPLPNPREMGSMSATPKKRPRTSNFIDAVSKERRQYRGSKIGEERDSEELRIEQVHTCLICKGKDSSGRMDREANNLSFRDPKKMFMHYGKHLYDEGRLFKHIPPVDGSAEGFDEYGRVYRYKCGFKGCWKATKKDCGYKE